MNRMSRLNTIHASHTYSHQYSPMRHISHSTPDSSGRPRIAPSSRPFSASIKYSRRVILLKPKRASMTKVRYRLNGASSSDESSSTATMVATPCASGEPNQLLQMSARSWMPPPSVKASSNAASNRMPSIAMRGDMRQVAAREPQLGERGECQCGDENKGKLRCGHGGINLEKVFHREELPRSRKFFSGLHTVCSSYSS